MKAIRPSVLHEIVDVDPGVERFGEARGGFDLVAWHDMAVDVFKTPSGGSKSSASNCDAAFVFCAHGLLSQ